MRTFFNHVLLSWSAFSTFWRRAARMANRGDFMPHATVDCVEGQASSDEAALSAKASSSKRAIAPSKKRRSPHVFEVIEHCCAAGACHVFRGTLGTDGQLNPKGPRRWVGFPPCSGP